MHFPNPTLLLGLLLLFCPFTAGATFKNPLKNPNGSDPHMVYTGGYYYLTTTTWVDIQLTRATTLEGLKTAVPKVVWSGDARNGNFWAPELHWIDNRWYLYYTSGSKKCCGDQRLHVLEGTSEALGPYTYKSLLSPTWGIDATILRFPSNKNYLVWSRFSPRNLQSLYIAPMINPWTINEKEQQLLSEPTETWERIGNPVNEGPAAMYHGGKTYLTYSASDCWTTGYSLGLLTFVGGGGGSDPVLDQRSWRKSGGPVFVSAGGNLGTGHNGFFQSPDGTEIWNVYHATKVSTGACDGRRYTMAQKVNWNSDNTPDFGSSPELGVVLKGPSGE